MTEHYYSEEQKSSGDTKKISQRINGQHFEFYTSKGVFSKEHVDKGTLALAESMVILPDSKVLDMGCGIGILGIAAAKLFDASVFMSDINKRAVTLAKKNLGLNKVKGTILQGNLFEKVTDDDFDVILSNPPQHAGKEICFKLIEESVKYLKKNGSFQLVARHNKGGKTLSMKMEEVYGNSEIIAKRHGFTVYRSIKL
ncbi:MAG TPA: methyltransferase [Candidatus Nanoarchaeia archaeon]|nr:methyltransferase [Candidatus Nanoarchaeia archaeon]